MTNEASWFHFYGKSLILIKCSYDFPFSEYWSLSIMKQLLKKIMYVICGRVVYKSVKLEYFTSFF